MSSVIITQMEILQQCCTTNMTMLCRPIRVIVMAACGLFTVLARRPPAGGGGGGGPPRAVALVQ